MIRYTRKHQEYILLGLTRENRILRDGVSHEESNNK